MRFEKSAQRQETRFRRSRLTMAVSLDNLSPLVEQPVIFSTFGRGSSSRMSRRLRLAFSVFLRQQNRRRTSLAVLPHRFGDDPKLRAIVRMVRRQNP